MIRPGGPACDCPMTNCADPRRWRQAGLGAAAPSWLADGYRFVSARRLTAPVDIANIEPSLCGQMAPNWCILRATTRDYEFTIADDLAGGSVRAWSTAGPNAATAIVASFDPIFPDANTTIYRTTDGTAMYFAHVARADLPRVSGGSWAAVGFAFALGALGTLAAALS